MQDFRRSKVWQKSHRLVLDVYSVTAPFPEASDLGLWGRCDAELARFLQIGMGSASELEYHILPARDLKYIAAQTHDRINRQVVEVKRMIAPLIRHLRANPRTIAKTDRLND
ncbi:MAG: four helix bundle protein [Chloroflexi bacterium]|nr:four helix bundle protein [Chloroflexota bacterium]